MIKPLEISVDRYRRTDTDDDKYDYDDVFDDDDRCRWRRGVDDNDDKTRMVHMNSDRNNPIYDRAIRRDRLIILVALAVPMISVLIVALQPPKNNYDANSKENERQDHRIWAVLESLQENYYDEYSGSWRGSDSSIDPHRGTIDNGMIGWWNAANTLWVICKTIEDLRSCSSGNIDSNNDDHNQDDYSLNKNGTEQDFNSNGANGHTSDLLVLEDVIKTMFHTQNVSGIVRSRSYDDIGWVILGWIEAYHVTGNATYLTRSKELWNEILDQGSWTETPEECNGGFYWAGEEVVDDINGTVSVRLFYKNAITNSLFIMSSLELFFVEDDPTEKEKYLSWAKRVWKWIDRSDMIIYPPAKQTQTLSSISPPLFHESMNITTLEVCDGLELEDRNGQCNCNNEEGFTYNQGVLIGGLGLLHKAVQDSSFSAEATILDDDGNEKSNDDDSFAPKMLIEKADSIAYSVIHHPPNDWLDDNGILVEPCPVVDNGDGNECNEDQQQFKGIFVRYLRLYIDIVGSATPLEGLIKTFLDHQAEAVWTIASSSNHLIDFRWDCSNNEDNINYPYSHEVITNAITQTSGLDCLLAAYQCTSRRK
jgi:predicted alpha-1,6-mannanase (GH76 family)